jgi:hypothetical protein
MVSQYLILSDNKDDHVRDAYGCCAQSMITMKVALTRVNAFRS